ncbi:MAG: hypothetical protein MZV63_15650 [Marinilabiliales bacterium]|nr:hypothetical protein [Marinilabiliales bacterium]
MAISSANASAFVRSLVGEATAKFWTADEITLYLQFGMTKVLGEMHPFLWDRYKDYAYIVTTAGTSEYDAPSDAYKVSHIQITETGRKIRYISEDEWYKYAYVDSGVDVTDTDYFMVWYMKNLDEIADFPDSCRALIAVEAAIIARTKNEDVTSDLMVMRNEFKKAALTDLAMTNMHQIEAFGDYREEDTIDESYVWTWKGGKIKIASMD